MRIITEVMGMEGLSKMADLLFVLFIWTNDTARLDKYHQMQWHLAGNSASTNSHDHGFSFKKVESISSLTTNFDLGMTILMLSLT